MCDSCSALHTKVSYKRESIFDKMFNDPEIIEAILKDPWNPRNIKDKPRSESYSLVDEMNRIDRPIGIGQFRTP